jgi:thiamine-phosphate pyrophosphorylase
MMLNQLQPPLIYPITSGLTTNSTTSDSPEFRSILSFTEHAATAGISFIQLREKCLSARVLFELTKQCVERGSVKVLVNDRFDVALAAGAAGVHLTSQSLSTQIVRKTCGEQFIIGVSTHSVSEVRAARDGGADFVVFGPVFETESKRGFGPPQGLAQLEMVVRDVAPFPVLALGGVAPENVVDSFSVGASGVAAIGMFDETESLEETVATIRRIGGSTTLR